MTFSSEFVTVNGIRLHLRRLRSEGPAMVMIHGLTDSGACWGRVASQFTPRYDIIAVDLRGHGLSDAPQGGNPYTTHHNATDVIGVIEALHLYSVTLIGHSLGAATAAEVARLRPDLVRCLVLEDPPWSDDWALSNLEARAEKHEGWLTTLEELKLHSYEQILLLGHAQMPDWADEELAAWAKSQLEVRVQALDFILADRPAWQLEVRSLRCPTLLATGEIARGALISEAIAEEACGIFPELEVMRLEGAGHCVHRDRFDEYIAGLRRFLAAT